jgi:hypothetical protein
VIVYVLGDCTNPEALWAAVIFAAVGRIGQGLEKFGSETIKELFRLVDKAARKQKGDKNDRQI